MITARSLHYVYRIGNRSKSIRFFKDILGMKVLRHEEFQEGCEAQCNGPYDNRWSKTMIGYGPESNHFVIELAYNYGIKSYKLGNDCAGITIRSKDIIDRAKEQEYPIAEENNLYKLTSPDGYIFYVINEPTPENQDPIEKVTIHCQNLNESINYWHDILNMNIVSQDTKKASLSYEKSQASLELLQIEGKIDRAETAGRIAFAVPYDIQPLIDEKIKAKNQKILKDLISLDTPGKATVRVIILADPNDHEICFVDEEGFSQLSVVDPEGNELLEKYIKKDPFQEI